MTPTPAVAADEAPDKPESLEERDAKKLKTDEKPISDPNGTAAVSRTDDQSLKKADQPKKETKKEKIKDAVKKIIPGDGIGSRTRSRTKGA